MAQSEQVSIFEEADLVATRNKVRTHAKEVGLGLVDETKLITAASELGRNMLVYAGGGQVLIEQIDASNRRGVRISFEDKGPGIADIDLALTDGYSTTQSLGLGLPGSRRLVDEFDITTKMGQGTKIVVLQWKR